MRKIPKLLIALLVVAKCATIKASAVGYQIFSGSAAADVKFSAGIPDSTLEAAKLVRKQTSSSGDSADGVFNLSYGFVDSTPDAAIFVRTQHKAAADGGIKGSGALVESASDAAKPVRKHKFSGSVAADGVVKVSDGLIDSAPDAASPVRVHKFSSSVDSTLDSASDGLVDSSPDPANLIRKQKPLESVTTDSSGKVSNGFVDTKPDEASPVRAHRFSGSVAADGVIEVSDGLFVPTLEGSSIIARSAKKPKRIQSYADGDIQTFADTEEEKDEQEDDAATENSRASWVELIASVRTSNGKAVNKSSGRKGIDSSVLSEATDTFASRSKSQTDDMVAQLTSLSNLAAEADEASQTRSSIFIQNHNDTAGKSMVKQNKELLSSLALLLLIVPLMVSCCKPDDALEELYAAAHHALMFKESGDWRHSLIKFRELRQDQFRRNHPVYNTIEAHIGEPETQDQLHSLFLKLSDGEHLLTVEKLQLMLTRLHLEVTVPNASIVKDTPTPSDYAWLVNSLDRPLTCSTFVSTFALLLVVLVQAKYMPRAKMAIGNRAGEGEEVWDMKIEYYVEIRGEVACRASFQHGSL